MQTFEGIKCLKTYKKKRSLENKAGLFPSEGVTVGASEGKGLVFETIFMEKHRASLLQPVNAILPGRRRRSFPSSFSPVWRKR